MLRFLHDNAMQVAGFAQALVGVGIVIWHPAASTAAVLASFPTALGTFLAGLVITARKKNGVASGV